jgi:hypothetical protein
MGGLENQCGLVVMRGPLWLAQVTQIEVAELEVDGREAMWIRPFFSKFVGPVLQKRDKALQIVESPDHVLETLLGLLIGRVAFQGSLEE